MSRFRGSAVFLAAATLILLVAPRARATGMYGEPSPGEPEFGFSLGYANVDLGSGSTVNNEGAFRFDWGFSIAPIGVLPQIRVGADVGTSLVLDNSTRTIISHNGTLIVAGSSSVPLWFIEPELCLSWRQTFGARKEIFVEPGIAGGWTVGFLDIHDINDLNRSYHADASTAYGRVFLRAGAGVPTAMIGVEASYLVGGNMDFGGNASGDIQEYYLGFFGAIRF